MTTEGQAPDTLVERLNECVNDIEQNAGDANPERAVLVLREAASALTSLEAENKRLTEERDERLCRLHAPFGLGEENAALRSRLSDLERVLRAVVAYFCPVDGDPTEADLRDEDFWEGSHRGRPSKEYTEYWRIVDAARALLSQEQKP